MTVTFERIETPDEAIGRLDAVLPAYQEVYAEPPYSEGPQDAVDFLGRAQRQSRRDGFRIVLAWDGSEVVGFSIGYLLPVNTGWWGTLLEPLADDFVRESGRRTFNVAELAVRKAWRRRGIAAGLHRRLIEGLDAERITLTRRPEPEAAPAQTAYASWGYQKVGQMRPSSEAPTYDVMVLFLR
ncbi:MULTISPECIES: GNAT family N-acetyltransferase [unclassified Streptomyces]|uniref:GNAT family N-acetyltransferase n=1 Tax=unclassified Streptomyces TaxID=2593676 RepID=UPI0037F85B6B